MLTVTHSSSVHQTYLHSCSRRCRARMHWYIDRCSDTGTDHHRMLHRHAENTSKLIRVNALSQSPCVKFVARLYQRCMDTNAGTRSIDRYFRQGGNVFSRVCLFACLSVCLLAISHINYWSDLYETFTKDVPVDNEKPTKCWNSSASGSWIYISWKKLQHYNRPETEPSGQ